MRRWPAIVIATIVLMVDVAASACPMCKDSVPNSDAQSAAGLPGGFNISIYYMLISLFAVMGWMGWMIVKEIRRTNRSHTPSGRLSASAARN